MAAARLHRGLVALSASAIAAVYLAGYLRTQSADASLGAAPEPVAVAQNVAAGAGAPAVVVRGQPAAAVPAPPPVGLGAAPTAIPAPARAVAAAPPAAQTAPGQTAPAAQTAPGAQSAPAAAAQGAYKDGTYTGQGTSRRGGVVVSVVIQSGRIASVAITQSTLQYPLRDIAGLPAEVVQRQTAQVDTVSRATYSSQAFKGAVAQALSKAG